MSEFKWQAEKAEAACGAQESDSGLGPPLQQPPPWEISPFTRRPSWQAARCYWSPLRCARSRARHHSRVASHQHKVGLDWTINASNSSASACPNGSSINGQFEDDWGPSIATLFTTPPHHSQAVKKNPACSSSFCEKKVLGNKTARDPNVLNVKQILQKLCLPLNYKTGREYCHLQ